MIIEIPPGSPAQDGSACGAARVASRRRRLAAAEARRGWRPRPASPSVSSGHAPERLTRTTAKAGSCSRTAARSRGARSRSRSQSHGRSRSKSGSVPSDGRQPGEAVGHALHALPSPHRHVVVVGAQRGERHEDTRPARTPAMTGERLSMPAVLADLLAELGPQRWSCRARPSHALPCRRRSGRPGRARCRPR